MTAKTDVIENACLRPPVRRGAQGAARALKIFLTCASCLVCALMFAPANCGNTQGQGTDDNAARPMEFINHGNDMADVVTEPVKSFPDVAVKSADTVLTAKNTGRNRAASAPQRPAASKGKIDIDLTKLNPMMVYAQVSHMMTSPQSHLGKTVKAQGMYNAWAHTGTGRYHHFVVVSDAAGCCPAGIEFRRSGSHKYPDDYPPVDAAIEVTGVFSTYTWADWPYYYLATDGITVLER